jgi:Isochorismatase family
MTRGSMNRMSAVKTPNLFNTTMVDRGQCFCDLLAHRRPTFQFFELFRPTVLYRTTAPAGHRLSSLAYPERLDVFPDKPVLERTSMNSWDEKTLHDALKANRQNKVVVSGLWIEVCNNTFALSRHARGRLRDLHGYRRLRRHVQIGAGLRDAAHDPGRRRPCERRRAPQVTTRALEACRFCTPV